MLLRRYSGISQLLRHRAATPSTIRRMLLSSVQRIALPGRVLSSDVPAPSRAPTPPVHKNKGAVDEREVLEFLSAVSSRQQQQQNGADDHATAPSTAGASLFGADGRELLARLRHHKQPDLTWKVYTRLRDAGALSAADYNEFLYVMSFSPSFNHAARVRLLEEDMRMAGVLDEADAFQVSSIIRARARDNDLAGATAAFDALQNAAKIRNRPLPHWVVISYLGACARAGDATRALELHGTYFAAHLSPPASDSPDRTAQYERARLSLALVMSALARSGEGERAEQLLDEALARGTTLLPNHVNALLLACVRASDSDEALRVFEARFGAAGAPPPDELSYMLLLKACVSSGDMATALEVRHRAVEAGVTLGSQVDLSVIRGFVEAGEMGSAWRVYEQAREARGTPNLTIVETLTRACWTASQDAVDDAERAMWMERAVSLFADGQGLVERRMTLGSAERHAERHALPGVPGTGAHDGIGGVALDGDWGAEDHGRQRPQSGHGGARGSAWPNIDREPETAPKRRSKGTKGPRRPSTIEAGRR